MKVIAQAPKDWTLQVTCKTCETQLEAEKSDVLYGDFYSGMDAEMSMDYYLVCPICKEYIFLDEKKLPNHVKFQAKQIFDANGGRR